MFSYNEVDPNRNSDDIGDHAWSLLWGTGNTLIKEIKEKWKFDCKTEEGTEFCKNEKEHFLVSVITDKTHIYPCLKHILFSKDGK
jgi:hypothetical protein